MVDPRFFVNKGPFTLAQIAQTAGLAASEIDTAKVISDVAPLDKATEQDISFFDNPKYLEQFKVSRAGACFVREKYAVHAPSTMRCLMTEDPYRAYALAAQAFYPIAAADTTGISPHAHIHETARIGTGTTIEAGAVIGAQVDIGENCHIGANAVIGKGVVIGKSTSIGANSTLSHCLVGSHVIIHRGVHIGQDGFGFAMGRDGHIKVPQLGRVVIDEHVEIGSGTTIDRGTGPDTHIGEGSKIDNLVQIGHNVHIGKHAVIVAHSGISGSTRIGDGAVLGGQSGIAGHLYIGHGARVAAQSGVMTDIPAGKSYGGTPAIPIKDWHRQTIMLSKLNKKRGADE